MLRIMFIIASILIVAECANGAELTQRDNGFNWQDREYFGRAYTERQLGGGDAAAGDAGDGGAAAGSGSGGGTGGDSGDGGGTGSGCGR